MRRDILLAVTALAVCWIAPQAATQAPATGPADAHHRRAVPAAPSSIENRPAGAAKKISELVRLRLKDDVLGVDIDEMPPAEQPMRLELTDDDGNWAVRTVGQGPDRRISITRWDNAAYDTGVWMVTLDLQPGNPLSITVRIGNGAFHYTQSAEGAVRLDVKGQRLIGQNIVELARAHPEAARDILRPMLAAFGGHSLLRPGATDVYRVFGDIPADPNTVDKLQRDIMPHLDAADFDQRQAAAEALAKLGRLGVLAVLRTEREELSQEQIQRLDLFLARFAKLKLDDAAAARRDPDFLLDCLSDEDPRIRQAALNALGKLTGKAIAFDLKLPQDEAARAADRLRATLPRPRSQ